MSETSGGIRVVRADDPVRAELEAAGWVAVGESWGARLRVDEETSERLRRIVDSSVSSGIALRRMADDEADAVARLEAGSVPDYPVTPATGHDAPTADDIREYATAGRVYVAEVDGELCGVTAMHPETDRWETVFTSVASAFRGRGIATALKAFAVLDLIDAGVRTFGTGGAQINEASRRMNAAVGYMLEETWISLSAPSTSHRG